MDFTDLVLKPCKICGRSFNLVSLDKHESICESNRKLTKRTVFKSFMQRCKEIDLVPLEKDEDKIKLKCREQESKSRQSLNLLNNGQSSMKKSIPPDYQQCPSCDRYFNKKAADRHINWCQEQGHRLQKTPPNPEALQRLHARIKYVAPRPRKKSLPDGSLRLIKSAESVRDFYRLRTHSSPSIHSCNISYDSFNQNAKQMENKLQRDNFSYNKNKPKNNISNAGMQEQGIKKSLKFKEQFPLHDKERNKNLDMLKTLRLHLSQLSTSDEHLDSYVLQSNLQGNQRCNSDNFSLPVMNTKSVDNAINFNNNYSSKDNQSISPNAGDNLEKRMPKFCYNCGTKYPVANAKYCCECGVQRIVLGF